MELAILSVDSVPAQAQGEKGHGLGQQFLMRHQFFIASYRYYVLGYIWACEAVKKTEHQSSKPSRSRLGATNFWRPNSSNYNATTITTLRSILLIIEDEEHEASLASLLENGDGQSRFSRHQFNRLLPYYLFQSSDSLLQHSTVQHFSCPLS